MEKVKLTKDKNWFILDLPYCTFRYWRRFAHYGFSGRNRFTLWRFEFIWYGY
jgi:hypothetical protein